MLTGEVLHIHEDSILVIKVPSGLDRREMEAFRVSVRDRLHKYGFPKQVPVWALTEGFSMETLTDADLDRLGLMRKR